MPNKLVAALLIAVILSARPAAAETLRFAPGLAGWTAVEFPGIAPANFAATADGALAIVTDASAGMLWRRLTDTATQATVARWRWRVDEGVAPADLSRRRVDDRAIGVYFVFSERPDLASSAMAVLASPTVTALVYVFGSDLPRGSVVASPHMGARGKFIVLRPADAPKRVWYDERVNLARDYERAFARPMPRLIAIAISSDSDDTRARNRARVQDVVVGE